MRPRPARPTARAGRLLVLGVWLSASLACQRKPAASANPQADVAPTLDATDADAPKDLSQPTDAGQDALDIPEQPTTDTALDVDTGQEPVPLCGQPSGTACPSPAGCCAQACPAPYPCQCANGYACGWAPMPDGIKPRINAQAMFGGGKYWVFGGLAVASNGWNPYAWFLDGEVYDPQTQTWEAIPAAPIQPMAVVWGGDRLYVAGVAPTDGKMTAAQKALPTMAAWVPAKKQWQPLPKEGGPSSCFTSPKLAWIGDRLLEFGCTRPGGAGGAMYLPDADTWTDLPPPPIADDSQVVAGSGWTGSAFVVLTKVYEFDAKLGEVATSKLLVFHPATNKWNVFSDFQPTKSLISSVLPVVTSHGIAVLGTGTYGEKVPAKLYLHDQDVPGWQAFELPGSVPNWCDGANCWPSARLAWSGKYVAIINGSSDETNQDAALYDLAAGKWIDVPLQGALSPRQGYAIASDGAAVFLSHGGLPTYPEFTAVSKGATLLLPP